MNHRHLLPEEVDLLLDDEVGFGVGPLKTHVRECADCRARVDEARLVVTALERLPHFATRHSFSDQVMAQVPVFVPWHAAAREAVKQWVPRSRPARVWVGVAATSVASMVTLVLLWIATQTDMVAVASGMAGDRVSDLVRQLGQAAIGAVVGDQASVAVQRGGVVGIAIVLVGFIAAAGGTLAGLRAIAVTSGRRRG